MRKINIHLTLDPTGVSYCYEVNAGIRSITASVITFAPSAPMIPHVSLLMGQLKDDNALPTVANIVRDLAKGYRPLRFRVDPPYLENVRNRYIFSDVRAEDAFFALKNNLSALLDGNYLETQADYTEQPHITLGHIEDHRQEVTEFLQGVRADLLLSCHSVEISDVGPKGTCINSLYTIPLAQSPTEGREL